MNELVNQIRLFIISMGMLLALAMLAVFFPIQDIMNKTLTNSFKTEAVITLTALNDFIDTCSMEASAIARRPELRSKTIQYKRGKIDYSQLVEFTTPCYQEACASLQYCLAAVRLLDNRIVATYSQSDMLDRSQLLSYHNKDLTVVYYPFKGQDYFLVVCPVLDGDNPIAYDYMLFKPESLENRVNNITHNYSIIRQTDFKSEGTGIIRVDDNLYEKASSIFFHDYIKNTDAILIMSITKKELFSPVRSATYRTLTIICLTLIMTGILIYLTLYSTARQILNKVKANNTILEAEKAKVEKLASGQRDLFNIFRYLSECWTLDDDFKVLKNSLPYIIEYRNFLMAVRPSRAAINFKLKEVTGDYEAYNPSGLFGKDPGIMEEVLLSGHPVFTGDLPAEQLHGRYRRDVNSLIIVPIVYKNFIWGSISIDHLDKNAFTTLDYDLMDMLASHIALHLEEMEAKRKLNDQAERLRSLHGLIGQMALERNNQAMINRLLSDLLASFDLAALGVYRITRPAADMNFEPLVSSGNASLLPSTDAADLAMLREVAVSQSLKIINQPARGHLLLTPIVYQDFLHGIFCAVKDDVFSDDYVDVVWIITGYLAIFWELNILLYRTERDALIDPLTGVWNRRYIMKQIEIEDNKLIRSGGECCLAIIDLGDFKRINDLYGHRVGDEVLKLTASTIGRVIRSSDSVGRYGGDEFIVLLPGTSPQQAASILNRINEEIADNLPLYITTPIVADFGIASCPHDTHSLLEAINIADERMYNNKRQRKGM